MAHEFQDVVSSAPILASESQISFTRLPDRQMRDTYYDTEGAEMEAKGIWIRNRGCRMLHTSEYPFNNASALPQTLEAKVKIAGDHIDSRFLELTDESAIRSLLQQHVPDTPLEQLFITADLQTHRKTWLVRDMASLGRSEPGADIRIDLDRITIPSSNSDPSEQFEHEVGEIEMTKESKGQEQNEQSAEARAAAAKSMRDYLEAFMARHSSLFPGSPKPKGKLGAYFEWKQRSKDREMDHR